MSRRRQTVRAAVRGALVASATVMAAALVTLLVAALVGYRPVVILTGSMGDTAPPGSLAIAAPSASVQVGDVLVMRGEDRATITHRVVDIEAADDRLLAVTRGDANPDRDAEPYALGERELVVEWVIPEAGRLTLAIRNPLLGVALMAIVVGAFVVMALRRIWAPAVARSIDDPAEASAPLAAGGSVRRFVRPRQLVGATIVGASLVTGGVALSLYVGIDTVAANQFSTLPCFESRLDDVQSGELTVSSDGVTTVPVLAVDPTKAFLLFSVASADPDADESTVLGRLASSTEIEFVRQADGLPPGPVDVAWSLVEYACGLTVQRGEIAGDGASTQLDDAISSVDPALSFVIGSSVSGAGATTFGADQTTAFEIADATTVRVSAGSAPAAGSLHAWQVVTFDHRNDGSVQHLSGTVADGASTSTISIPSTVDPDVTLVLASLRAASTTPAVADRLVRVRLLDDSTVELSRQGTVGDVDVRVQVVELGDGSAVSRGVLEFGAGDSSATATIAPVAAARSTAVSAALLAGGNGGGSTAHALGTVGEGSARVHISGPTSVEVERAATSSGASFAWQVITWGGPTWADLDAPFRRRIDVTAGSVLAPDGYTTSFEIDHADLVAQDASLASGDDLRVWRFDGAVWTELDRVLDDDAAWNATDTTLWFRTQEAIAAGATVSYWLYFGDAVPDPPLADPDNVWLATEDFDDGTLGVFEDRTSGSGWYAADPWTTRIELTIDPSAVASDLSDEAVLVRLTDATVAASARPDGSDVRFTASDGTTPLAHELEAYDSATGTITAWVRVPNISSSAPTTLYLYAGAPNAPDQADPRTVWSDASAVWQLAADPAGDAPTLADSGPLRLDGIALADATLAATPTGPAVSLDGSLDRLESAPVVLQGNALTAAAWFEAAAPLAADAVLVAQGDPTTTGVFELGIDATTTPGSPTARVSLRLDGLPVELSGGAITAGAWHHVAVSWDGLVARLFVDGAEVASASPGGSIAPVAAAPIVIGADPGGADAFAGLIGQIRLDDVAWSADRVAFVADNLRAPGVVAAGAPIAGTWFDQGAWAVRRPLSVDADLIAGPLVDYPLLVQLTDADLAATTQSDGDDLVFTAGDGVTRLDHFVEHWDGATGELTAWVRVPALDAVADTRLYLYTSNPTAVDQQDPIGVWGPDADLVVTGATP